MNLASRKLHIIERILEIEDQETLDQIELYLSSFAFKWEDLDEKEKSSILRGLEQAKRGEGIPHEEVVKMFPKWLSE